MSTLDQRKMDDYRLQLGTKELKPIVIGGMGVNISTQDLALEAARLGGIGHVSDAMLPAVSDYLYETGYTGRKARAYKTIPILDNKAGMTFEARDIEEATRQFVTDVMSKKQGDGLIFINCMEKLTMNESLPTLKARLCAALDAGIDGISLSAGLHTSSFGLMADHPRFHDAKLGIVVSSVRALNIFLRRTAKTGRKPDFIVIEGPLAGGHLGFGFDWAEYKLETIVDEVLAFLKEQQLDIPVIAGGGVFTGTDGVKLLAKGVGGVQVATRFTITQESGLPDEVKVKYLDAQEDDIVVNGISPTGYPMRMLKNSPAICSDVQPQCNAYGYLLDKGECQYLTAYRQAAEANPTAKRHTICTKTCLCYQMRNFRVYTCGAATHRLKETTVRLDDGSWYFPPAEHIFNDYLLSTHNTISLPTVPAGYVRLAS